MTDNEVVWIVTRTNNHMIAKITGHDTLPVAAFSTKQAAIDFCRQDGGWISELKVQS